MKRSRNAKNGRKKTKSTRKGQVRRTARRAYTGLKRRVSRRKKSDSAWNF